VCCAECTKHRAPRGSMLCQIHGGVCAVCVVQSAQNTEYHVAACYVKSMVVCVLCVLCRVHKTQSTTWQHVMSNSWWCVCCVCCAECTKHRAPRGSTLCQIHGGVCAVCVVQSAQNTENHVAVRYVKSMVLCVLCTLHNTRNTHTTMDLT